MYTLAEIIERLSKSMQDHEAMVTGQSEFANLSVTQIHYLDAIRHLEQPTIGALADYQKVAKPTVTVALDNLERMGYITKISSADDRRVSHVHLTKKGLRISDLHDEIHRSYAAHFQKALGKRDCAQLVALLNIVITSLGL
jgi:DNA-binding MarR family transcriptional regulator